MEQVVLKAERREVVGKHVKSLRREGKLPAILYGKQISPIPVVLDWREASRILGRLTRSSLVQIDLGTEKHTALVREKQRNHLTGALLHVDFQVISMTEVIRTRVSVEVVGESPAVKVLNGILVVSMENLEVESLPGDLPSQIEIDISGLKEIGDSLQVRDLVISSKVTVLEDPEAVVVVVTAQQAEEAIPGEGAGEEPEVMTKGKKEEEE